jgi:ribose transport system ATP-binding protein
VSTTPAVRLKVDKLTKSFFGVRVLHEVSFEACKGQVLGVVGENGSGKSTTMNVITGVVARDGGEVWLDGEIFMPASRRESDAAGIAFIQQELNIFPNLSVAENLFLARPPRITEKLPFVSRRRLHAQATELLARVDLDVTPDTLAAELSAGERQLLEIGRALSADARVFIFDEPTSSLSAREAARLFALIQRIKASGGAVLFISHNLDDVLRISDRIVVMRDGCVALRVTNRDITPDQLVPAMVGRSIETLFPERPVTHVVDTPLLKVVGLSREGVLRDVSLQVGRGEIVGIAGLMGSGRSELARTIFGLDAHERGTVLLDGQPLRSQDLGQRLDSGMAFVTEDRRHEGLMLDATVAENFALAALPLFARGKFSALDRTSLTDSLGSLANRLRLKSADIGTTPVRTLSGGNQQKVVLGRWLLRQPRLFILDEPTRGVDVGAKHEIYQLLAELAAQGMAILVISSELEELVGLCDRLYVMRAGALTAEFARSEFDGEAILKVAFGQEKAA